jgi:hypothetical protein
MVMDGRMHIAPASGLNGRTVPVELRASAVYYYSYYACPRAGPF